MIINIEGLDRIEKFVIDELCDENKINKALGKACALIEASAKEKCPKDTGNLQGSITSEVKDKTGTVFTPVEYAPYVEFGTGLFAEEGGRTDVPWRYQDDEGHWHSTMGQKPQPFLRPALDDNIDEVMEILAEGIVK